MTNIVEQALALYQQTSDAETQGEFERAEVLYLFQASTKWARSVSCQWDYISPEY